MAATGTDLETASQIPQAPGSVIVRTHKGGESSFVSASSFMQKKSCHMVPV